MRQWILLRGLTREAAHWGTFAADFERGLPNDRVVMLDLPGNGQFCDQASPASVPGMVQACREALAAREIAPPYHLLAMSLGAMVGIEWARVAGHEVAGGVLINTSVRPFSPLHHRLRPRNYAALVGLALRSQSTAAVEETVLRLTSNRVSEHRGVVKDWAAVRAQRPVSTANALRQLWAAARYRAPAAAPIERMLLLVSRNDGLVRGECSVAIANAWQRPVVSHPFAGHDLPLDDAQWVVEQVRRWLAEESAGC
ncbi:MAG: alpha/beta hydrolase [Comamonadaceae bacterium]|nr:MAG: alpha/beta hydrolase [Comamonadaceae bacterium]